MPPVAIPSNSPRFIAKSIRCSPRYIAKSARGTPPYVVPIKSFSPRSTKPIRGSFAPSDGRKSDRISLKPDRCSRNIAHRRMTPAAILTKYKEEGDELESWRSATARISHVGYDKEDNDSLDGLDAEDVSVQDPDEILADAWETVGEEECEIQEIDHLTPCMVVLPDNLVELINEGDLDENLRQQLLGYPESDVNVSLARTPRPPVKVSSVKSKAKRNPWYLPATTWYVAENEEDAHDLKGGLAAEDKANVNICDVYRRYCVKEGKRVPDCLL